MKVFLAYLVSLYAYARLSSANRTVLASLSHISFDDSKENPENGVVYAISMRDRFQARPRFSIYPESVFSNYVEGEEILAKGVWQDRMNHTGWNHLRIDIMEEVDALDNHKSYAAGVLEGFLSRARIRDFFLNTRGMIHFQKGGPQAVKPVREIFRRSIERIKEAGLWDHDNPLNSRDSEKPVDQLARLAVFQIWGISDGYESARQVFHPNELWSVWPKIDVIDMHFLSADGDFPDLKDAIPGDPSGDDGIPVNATPAPVSSTQDDGSQDPAFLQTRRPRRSNSDQDDLYVGSRRRQYDRCSALVRLAYDNSELFVGHSTWEPFSEMTRIIKFYNFPFKGVASRQLAFPSYPGAITSTDDFIITSSGLVLTETTIDIKDRDLFRRRSNIENKRGKFSDFIKPLVAARLARTGREWVDVFTRSASSFWGVASCQWMIIDYNKFNRNSKDVDRGLLYVLEGIPGLIHSRDMTKHLALRGYWGSANRAWFRDVREILGDKKRLANDTAPLSIFSRNENPRAFTFKHLAPKVETLQDMERLMQFSAAAPEAGGPPSNVAIAPRFDLSDKKQTPEGATDSKVIDSSLVHDLSFVGISGPEHQRHEPFSWTNEKGKNKFDENIWPHRGMPSLWNFTWHLIDQNGLKELRRTPVLMTKESNDWSNELSEAFNKTVRDKDEDDIDYRFEVQRL